MASTKDRQRALERARYERVQGKIAQKRRAAARKRRIAIVSTVAAVVVAAGVTLALALPSNSAKTPTAAGSSPSAAASAAATASADTNPMKYVADGTSSKPGIGVPTFNAADADKTYTVTLQTNRGNVVIKMDGKAAPYTVYSFIYLAGKNYFDNTKCHRLVTAGIYVLQCGDPTGTGTGGPGYTLPDENLASLGQPDANGTVTYKAGTVAMAKTSQPHSGGSQFFLVYKDSPLGPSYTPFGTITQGMDVLQAIAAKGSNNANQQGDGAPNESVQIEKVTFTSS